MNVAVSEYGYFPLQRLFELCPSPQEKALIFRHVKPCVLEIVNHPNANYVFCEAVKSVRQDHFEIIAEIMIKNTWMICSD